MAKSVQYLSGPDHKWNDPAIKELNPKLNLPATAIPLVHRSDGSGTTFNFTNYLGKVNPEWQRRSAPTPPSLARRYRRQGQCRRGGRCSRCGLHRLRRIRLRQADHLTIRPDGQRRRQTGQARPSNLPALLPPTPIGRAASGQGFNMVLVDRPGANRLADHWRPTLVIMAQKSDGQGRCRRSALKFFKFAFEKGDAAATELQLCPAARKRRKGY